MRQSVARWPCRRGSGSVSWCELAPCAEVSVTVGQLLSASEAAPVQLGQWGEPCPHSAVGAVAVVVPSPRGVALQAGTVWAGGERVSLR